MGKKKNFVMCGEESQVKGDNVGPTTVVWKDEEGKKEISKGVRQARVEEDKDDAPELMFVGKEEELKKGGVKSSFELLGDGDDHVKKLSKGGSKKMGDSKAGFGISEGEEDIGDDDFRSEEGEALAVSFVGKKKKKMSSEGLKKGGSLFSAALLEDDDGVAEEADEVFAFTGEIKSPKKKGSSAFAALGDDVMNEMELNVAHVAANNSEVSDSVPQEKFNAVGAEASKNKKKKKKGGKAAEEDTLDKILAELGEGPSVSPTLASTSPPQVEKVDTRMVSVVTEATGEKEVANEETVESAAAKKKKKKKEKEKEKKAAAAAAAASEINEKEEVKNETKSKVSDKKLPKHIREMQEALARRKEAEERKRREEEERLRKEEEERRRQEELLRQEEEAKRRRKEKEKEKLRQKKEAGLLLTAKQKEEQRRREIMKNQFLANIGIKLPASDNGAPTKRPTYTTKKSKNQANGLKVQSLEDMETKFEAVGDGESVEMEKIEDVGTMDSEEMVEVPVEVKENVVDQIKEFFASEEEEDDDEDWDAKSWDDTDLALPVKRAFEDEEADLVASVRGAALRSSGVKPAAAAKTADSKQKHSDTEVTGNRSKVAEVQKEIQVLIPRPRKVKKTLGLQSAA